MSQEWITFILFTAMPLAAFLYASVGHGGASSYIMIMTWLQFSPQEIKPTALLINILVSGFAFYNYFNKDTFPWKIFLALSLSSIPMAYYGGSIQLSTTIYKQLVGLILILPGLRLLLESKNIGLEPRPSHWWLLVVIGLFVGFLSGMIGIGGGIFISPILLMMRWADAKTTSEVSALFIFVNSLSGLAGSKFSFQHIPHEIYWLVPISMLSGILGSYIGAQKLKIPQLNIALGLVLFIAATKFILS